MNITALVENTTETELKPIHGLSFYIETKLHKILFDLGPDHTLIENAEKKDIDLSKIDTVIISHGHYDHGGALKDFLAVNSCAEIYVQRDAFQPHYSRTGSTSIPIGIDDELKSNKQVVLLEGDFIIDDELSLFIADTRDQCYSPVNDVLYEGRRKDAFEHEQNLIVSENKTVLFMGCGHAGVVNIMKKAEKFQPDYCIGGFHLFNPVSEETVSGQLLNDIGASLQKYQNTEFYTCHCTGRKAFDYLSHRMNNLHYFSCGKMMEL